MSHDNHDYCSTEQSTLCLNQRENVVVNFADQSISVTSDLYVEAENSLLACIALTFLCLLVEFVMIFHGGTMFYDISNFAGIAIVKNTSPLFARCRCGALQLVCD